ncbi:hypothetical protein RhiirA1_484603 [Rhizophagus irregularis]|uniref:Uncharacterized protein n=1 Tax=Rhizophagus irregularis TaxID=588596 RepID=A0A2N0QJ49_9GLOM|nr:hypothetical protein RhiirA1_484603 [Rhizophagus irregularis]
MDATGPPITDAIGDQTKNRPPSSLARQEPTRRGGCRPLHAPLLNTMPQTFPAASER